ncbi:hypothetical protein [Erwinia sp. V71]|uniref:hypothetical protein n=1 Tax=Erwinia sp. V71 TaxID=3369424 RepID=UPI003F630593
MPFDKKVNHDSRMPGRVLPVSGIAIEQMLCGKSPDFLPPGKVTRDETVQILMAVILRF